jgi:hypothetical protein
MPSLLDILGYAGNALDLPGSSVRDLLTGNNPFDQWLTPFSDGNRATGRDVLHARFGVSENEETGMSGWLDNPMEGVKDIAGFGAEMLLDPTNLIPGGAILKALKGRKAAKVANAGIDAENLANAGKYSMVNPKVAGRPEVPTSPTLPEGIPELQPGFARAVHWASPENVDQIRESGLDYSRQGMLSSTAQVWGDGSKVNYSPPNDPRFSGGQAVIFDFPEGELRLHDNIARSPGVLDPKYFVGAVPGPKPQPKNPMTAAPNWKDQVADLESRKDDLLYSAGAYEENMGAGVLFDEISIARGEGLTDGTMASLDRAGYRAEYDDLSRQVESLRAENPMKRLGYTPGGEDPMFPGKETMHHGGHDMSASATEQHPYGIFDLGRLKTGEGANIFSPGAYKADVEATSARYQEIVQDKLDEEFYRGESALAKYFEPGKTLLQGYMGERVDRVLEFKPGGNGEQWAVKVQGMAEDSQGVYRPSGQPRWHSTVPDRPEMYKLLGKNPNRARLYKYDTPLGTKDSFMKWEGGIHDQPPAAQEFINSNPTVQKFDQYASLQENTDAARREIATLKKQYGIDPLTPVKDGDPTPLLEARRRLQESIQGELAFKAEMTGTGGIHPYYFDQMADKLWTGEDLAQVLMGNRPADATLADTAGLKAAGVPGMKNLAGSTRGQTYNYAIWDQDLLNQMRVREIDGQRMPINPTTMVEQQAVPARRGIAEDDLLDMTNPMREKMEVPNAMKPIVAGAVFHLLARQNNYGGAF